MSRTLIRTPARAPFLAFALLASGCLEGGHGGPPHVPGTPINASELRGSHVASTCPEAVPDPAAHGGVPVHPRDLPPCEPIRYAPEPPVHAALSNGVKVFVEEEHAVPLVAVMVYLRTGVLEESPGKTGVARLTGQLLREGGVGDLDPDALDTALENRAASLDAGITDDMGVITLNCRTRDLPWALDLLRDLLTRPRFDPSRVAVAKEQLLENLRRRKDRPGQLAEEAFADLVYGTDSPWARQPTLDGVAAITAEDIAAFHKEHVLPCLWSFAVSGDVSRDALIKELESRFGSLSRRQDAGIQPPPPPVPGDPRVVLIPKAINQATLMMGHAAPPNLMNGMPHPDRYALQLFNYILGGGGFGSRLTKEVRVLKGLAYSVHSALAMDAGRGQMEMNCQTRTEAAMDSVKTLREVLARTVEEGPTEAELRAAKDAFVNAFVFKGATAQARVMNAVLYDYMGFPPDYLTHYVEHIQAVTLDDLHRVAKAHYHPGKVHLVVCGDRQALEGPLSEGGVTVEIREP